MESLGGGVVPPGGGTVTTDPSSLGATPDAPVQVAVASSTAGTISIVVTSATSPAPPGFEILGKDVDITAPDASPAEPMRFTFRMDASLVPIADDPGSVTVFRNGSAVPECPGATAAVPNDPCVTARVLADGDVDISVLSSHASIWQLAAEPTREVLGKSFAVTDRSSGQDAALRTVTVFAKETAAADLVVGDPAAHGATLEIIANGSNPTHQTFDLPPGVASRSSAGWKSLKKPATGFAYSDPSGAHGPVKSVMMERTASGVLLSARSP